MYKTVIVGLGKIGMEYDYSLNQKKYIMTHAQSFNQNKNFEIIAGIDINELRRKQFTIKFKKPSFKSISLFDFHEPVDIFIVATPTTSHKKIISDIIKKYRPKLILCEKPIAYKTEEAKYILNICKDNKIKLYINYMRRSDPAILKISKMISNKKFIMPVKGVVWYSKGLIHSGSHFVNLMQFLFGEVQDCKIINKRKGTNYYDIEADFELDFKKAKIVFISIKEENFSHYTFELIFKNARLRYDYAGNKITYEYPEKNKIIEGYSELIGKEFLLKAQINLHQLNVVKEIYNILNNKPNNLCSGKEAFETLKITHLINKIYEKK